MPLPFLKPKADAAPSTAPLWHPNFRNFERLPDTKVVRTTFFINVAAGVAAFAMVAVVGWRFFQVRNSQQQIAAAQTEIARNQKQNDEGLRLTKIFTDEDKKIAEAAAFVQVPIAPTELLLVLGRSLPKEIQVEFVDFAPNDPTNPRCLVRGLAAGTKDQASGSASAYVETLRTQPRLAEVFDTVKLNAINPDPATGALLFEIELRYKGKGPKK